MEEGAHQCSAQRTPLVLLRMVGKGETKEFKTLYLCRCLPFYVQFIPEYSIYFVDVWDLCFPLDSVTG